MFQFRQLADMRAKPGGIARRSMAFGLDALLLFAVLAPAGWAAQRLADLHPRTGQEIWLMLILTFSVPVWAYFILMDSSPRKGTVGKRVFRLRVVAESDGERVPLSRNALRTLLKLMPWEMAHVSAFALSEDMASLDALQVGGLVSGNLLALGYFVVAVATGGRRSVHDLVTGSAVVADTP